MTKVTAAELITHALNETGLKSVEVANEYGVSPASVSNWKNGRFFPTYHDLDAILDFMGFDLPELIKELRLKKAIGEIKL